MNILLITLACLLGLLSGSGGVIVEGHSLYYARNVMERVYRVRIRQGLAAPGWTGGLTAVPDCKRIGQVVRAQFLDPHTHTWTNYRSLLVVDCAQPYDYRMQIRTGRVAEVDWNTAVWAGFTDVGRTRARVVYGGNE